MDAKTKKILGSIAMILVVVAIDKQLGLTDKVARLIPGGAV